MQKKIVTDTLRVLNEIKNKGYIRPEDNGIRSHYQKINHALAEFFKASPIDAKDALECMDQLTEICKNTSTFSSLFPQTMLELYDWSITGDSLTQKQAETKLLFFFSHISPLTIEQKKRLLNNMLNMPDFSPRKKEISKVSHQLINHYDKNQQFNEDPGLSVLTPLSTILHQVEYFHFPRSRNEGNQEKVSFAHCASIIKKYAPELYEDSWPEKFATTTPRRHQVPIIKEASIVYSRGSYIGNPKDFSKGWELD